ncbi:ABC transporter ATP-binding protein [Heyndrickxia sp. NPDC080065]|uniref:ABC transporter ATP-binding protein n=1 Tax=Heyndrickxia sp. NPDC080065 TaxID=3390568 RepID=UPI003D03F57D
MNPTVKIEQVSKSFGKKVVLNDINLNMEKGQIYGLIGPSGAGKTTLVKLIVGMDKADKGSIHVLNEKVPNLALLQNIGYMAQSDALYSELTGEENLRFFASLYKLNKTEQKKRIAYAAGLVNLTNELKKKVSAYSGGMKRRLSLAIALIPDPPILILDEPTVGIDPELRLSVWNELKRLKNEEEKTIIVTTHVMDEAEKCDVVAMVRDGSILTSGTPKQLKALYKVDNFDEVFLKAGGTSL